MGTLSLPREAAAKVSPKLRDPVAAAAKARKAAEEKERAARKAAEREARKAAKAASVAANLAAEKAHQIQAAKDRTKADRALWKTLCTSYPDLFNAEAPKPLAVRAGHDIAAALGISRKAVIRVLGRWTRRPQYHAAVAAGGQRFHLDGSEAGAITASDMAYAQQCYPAAAAKAEARQAQREQARQAKRRPRKAA